jgi:hypothetical protein
MQDDDPSTMHSLVSQVLFVYSRTHKHHTDNEPAVFLRPSKIKQLGEIGDRIEAEH